MTTLQAQRVPAMSSLFFGMYAVYAVSLLDEEYGINWVGDLKRMAPNTGWDTSFSSTPGDPIGDIADALKGLRHAFAHSLGRICALGDEKARARGECAERILSSVTIDNAPCSATLTCPGHGGGHKRLVLDEGFVFELDHALRRVLFAFNPDQLQGAIKTP